MNLVLGNYVRVADGDHPHYGREGRISAILGVQVATGQPRAMIRVAAKPYVVVVGVEFLDRVAAEDFAGDLETEGPRQRRLPRHRSNSRAAPAGFYRKWHLLPSKVFPRL